MTQKYNEKTKKSNRTHDKLYFVLQFINMCHLQSYGFRIR